MKNLKILAATGLMLGMLSACSATGSPAGDSLLDGGAMMLNQEEVTAMFSEHTDTWSEDKGAAYYTADGTYSFVYEGEAGAGTWSVNDNGTLCIQVEDWYGAEAKCNWQFFQQVDFITELKIDEQTTEVFDSESLTLGNSI